MEMAYRTQLGSLTKPHTLVTSRCDMDTRMPMSECYIELHSIEVKNLHLVCMPRPRAHFHVTNAC